ncbi:MAG: diphthine--ammonia ligase [Bacteroidetes bacterium]|nr:diphthine--ammonia ligase [Bacteroidota bacterium]
MSKQEKTKVIFSWSGGKDSALALHKILEVGEFEIFSLITTITEGYNRISMHGISVDLLEEQAKSIGIPLYKIEIPQNCSNEDYEMIMVKTLTHFQKQGISSVIFGDIYLEDVKNYRISQLSRIGMQAIFPLWGINTSEIVNEFIKKGFQSIISCVDIRAIDPKFSGRIFDQNFLNDLPTACDPCGENGEFHSFVFDGPIFFRKIKIKTGAKLLRDNYFFFTEILQKQ